MSFDSVFSEGLDSNILKLQTTNDIIDKTNQDLTDDNTSLSLLGSEYEDMVQTRTVSNLQTISSLETKKTNQLASIVKLNILINLDSNTKTVLYDCYITSGIRPNKFIRIIVDRYSEVATRSGAILDDVSLSDSEKANLLNIMIRSEGVNQNNMADGGCCIMTSFAKRATNPKRFV